MIALTDSQWCRYLKKYESVYVLKREEDGVWTIKCSKKGDEQNTIRPHDIGDTAPDMRELAYITFNSTWRRDTAWLRRFEKAHIKHHEHQRGSDGIIIVFDENDLGAVAKVVQPIARRAKKPIRKGVSA